MTYRAMQITKLGHSCLLVEDQNTRILIDPGAWSEGHTTVEGIDVILLTHEHQDHTDPKSLREILKRNPGVPIWANDGVGVVLTKEGIVWEKVTGGDTRDVKGVSIEAYGKDHAKIYHTWPVVQNTSYIIQGKLAVTWDCFTLPQKQVDVLALPVCAAWLKIMEAVDFARAVKPKKCFPVHDAAPRYLGSFHDAPAKELPLQGLYGFREQGL